MPAFSLIAIPRTASGIVSPRCFWKKQAFVDPSGQRTRESGRPSRWGNRIGSDGRVIDGQVALGDLLVGEENTIGMRQPNAGEHIRRIVLVL